MTTIKARQYKPATVRRLDLLSGNQCAEPQCTRKLVARDGVTIVSKICHIEAAEKGGARYNPNMTDDERRHYNNLILLCDECHSIIDNKENEGKYPVELLKHWKLEHESKAHAKLALNPSLLINAINAISKLGLEDEKDQENGSIKAFVIDKKIDFNSVKRNKFLIEEYKIYYSKINTLYSELETQGSFKKESLLRYIKNVYLQVKGTYIKDSTNVQEIIRENSDNIIEDIQDILSESIIKDGSVYKEDMEFGIAIIMVDAFMRCKILEEPK
jgi:hypothetical protein